MTTTTDKKTFVLQEIKKNFEEISLTSFIHKSERYPVDVDRQIRQLKPISPLYRFYEQSIRFFYTEVVSAIDSHLADLFDICEADLIYKRHSYIEFEKLTVEDNNIYIHYSLPNIKIILEEEDLDTASRKIATALYDNAMIQLADEDIYNIKNIRGFFNT